MSILGMVTICAMASAPAHTLMGMSCSASFSVSYLLSSPMHTTSGWNSRACATSISTLRWAQSAYTSKRSLFARTTSSVCVPILPVEPNIAICFAISFLYIVLPPFVGRVGVGPKIQLLPPGSPNARSSIVQTLIVAASRGARCSRLPAPACPRSLARYPHADTRSHTPRAAT